MSFVYETLPSGLTAVFGHRPHYETTSVRLMFRAGSLHENPSHPPGVAHFLEHTPFLGTDDLPTLDDVNRYVEEGGMDFNAYTSPTLTSYESDGSSDLYRAMHLAFQLGFHPRLTEDMVEMDRQGIIEEAREQQFGPYRAEVIHYDTLFAGPKYARLIQGNIEDVEQVQRHHLT